MPFDQIYPTHFNQSFSAPLSLRLNLSEFVPLFLPGICLTAPGALLGGSRTFIEMISSKKSDLYGGLFAI